MTVPAADTPAGAANTNPREQALLSRSLLPQETS